MHAAGAPAASGIEAVLRWPQQPAESGANAHAAQAPFRFHLAHWARAQSPALRQPGGTARRSCTGGGLVPRGGNPSGRTGLGVTGWRGLGPANAGPPQNANASSAFRGAAAWLSQEWPRRRPAKAAACGCSAPPRAGAAARWRAPTAAPCASSWTASSWARGLAPRWQCRRKLWSPPIRSCWMASGACAAGVAPLPLPLVTTRLHQPRFAIRHVFVLRNCSVASMGTTTAAAAVLHALHCLMSCGWSGHPCPHLCAGT